MTKQIGSSLTVLMVADVERSKRFYREKLGFDVTDWCAERGGLQGLALKLLQAPAGTEPAPNPPEAGGDVGVDVYAYVENWTALDDLYAEFGSQGAKIAREPTIYADGGPWKEFIVEDPDGYHLAFGGIDGDRARGMKVEIVERKTTLLATVRSRCDGQGTREAWSRVQEALRDCPLAVSDELGYVAIPEWQWAEGVSTLWTGVEVGGFDGLPAGLEKLEIPGRRYARLRVKGDREQMNRAYAYLNEWFRTEGLERDASEGSFGMEANRLKPVDPFSIPADEIDAFDFEIFAPIKEKLTVESIRYPKVKKIEVRADKARAIAGLETFVPQRTGTKPDAVVGRLWQQFFRRADELPGRNGPAPTYGVLRYEPPYGPGQDFTYLGGIEADYNAPLPEGFVRATLPDRLIAVVTYQGRGSDIAQAWRYFHEEWLPSSGYRAVDGYDYEAYDERFLGPDREDSIMEVHFPIRFEGVPLRLTDRTVHDEKGEATLQDLRGANIRMVSLKGAELRGIDLRNASLEHVNFVNSRWRHIYFSNVHVDSAQLGGTVFENIRRPEAEASRFDEEAGTAGWVNVEPVTFRDSDLSAAIFDNCDLNGVDIRDCRIEGMRINGIPVKELLENYNRGEKRT
ncbi:GyrI-like domain-containing protein [Paenibacillaceae bacterium WGS1546]|uniref:GyrI-like domain-containing protein n=1 Tax=Cohnella sp. WGS1546 TaxID=3366810 RepID=UPI00372CE97A